jgi:hypothetical protein
VPRSSSPSARPAEGTPRRLLDLAYQDRGASPGPPPTRGRLRLLRATVLGAASLLLAVLAHPLGGHPLPGVAAGLLLLALTGVVALVATGRRCRLAVLFPLLGSEQVLVHLQLIGARPGACLAPDAMPRAHVDAISCHALAEDGLLSGADGAMLLAHVLATALTAWLLTRGEATLWQLCDGVVRAALPTLTARPSVRRPMDVRAPLPALRGVALPADATPRGPPVLVRAAG